MSKLGAIQDGKLRVFKWPSMELILNEANVHTSVKDLHFRFIAFAVPLFLYSYTASLKRKKNTSAALD